MAAQALWDAVAENGLDKVRLQRGHRVVWLTIKRGATL